MDQPGTIPSPGLKNLKKKKKTEKKSYFFKKSHPEQIYEPT